MTPGAEKEFIELVRREVAALERLADHFASEKDERVKRPAVLTTATYSREEREKKELRDTLHGKTPKVVVGVKDAL